VSTARTADAAPRPRLLDLFCGAGGAAMGYWRAGFDVVGVDNRPQPRYPFEFRLGDAMTWPLEGFDAIHVSPPCQDHSVASYGRTRGTGWMLAATRERLLGQSAPWVIENVPGAPMRPDLEVCGCVVGLPGLERKRWFETWPQLFDLRPGCHHTEPIVSVTGHGRCRTMAPGTGLVADWRRVMGIDWMTRDELSQAIPPAYTEYIGGLLLEQISEPRAAAQETLL
jgi:DNA (cytosine-5)-methyltransferase 1